MIKMMIEIKDPLDLPEIERHYHHLIKALLVAK
jgi:hypothetical protein